MNNTQSTQNPQPQRTPIEQLTDALAAMTARAIEAEKQRDEAAAIANNFFEQWKETAAALEKATERAEIKEKIKDIIAGGQDGSAENAEPEDGGEDHV